MKWMRWIWAMVIVGGLWGCLDEQDHTYKVTNTPAVVYIHGDSAYTMGVTRYGWLYASGFSSYSQGKCLLISFKYDPTNNTDAEELGYYTVTLSGVSSVTQQTASAIDASALETALTNEQLVAYAVNPSDSTYFGLLEDYLFIPSICWSGSDQTLTWQLQYDADPSPSVEDGLSVYDLYLRVAADSATVYDLTATATLNAFDISSFLTKAKAKRSSGTDLGIRLNYINYIDPADSSYLYWRTTDPITLN